MYIPKHYAAPSEAAALDLLQTVTLASLCWVEDGTPEATPLPWLPLIEGGRLQALHAHVPRKNPLVAAVAGCPAGEGLPVLAIFQGPAHYISPNWIPSKHETERQVPTWNYATVQVHGRLHLRDDAAWVRQQLETLTATHEAREAAPWRLEQAAPGYIDALQKALVGLELRVERLEAKFKLNQASDARDRAGMLAGLEAQGTPTAQALAALTRSALSA